MRAKEAEVLVPCTCGELVQGTFEGMPFLVSCPIDRYSVVKAILSEEADAVSIDNRCDESIAKQLPIDRKIPRDRSEGADVRPSLNPSYYVVVSHLEDDGVRHACSLGARGQKAIRAAESALAFLGYEKLSFRLEIACPLSPSKGFGTSTADVVGAIAAVGEALGRPFSPQEIARLAVSVEPSDGTMFPGLAIFDHRGGQYWRELGQAPPLIVVVLDFEGTVDTEEYNAGLDLAAVLRLEAEHAHALELLKMGLKSHHYKWIGEAATASAILNQRLLPKPQLESVISLGREFRAIGICAAHSGTALGVLFGPDENWNALRCLEEARKMLAGIADCWVSKMVDGGARVPLSSAWKHE